MATRQHLCQYENCREYTAVPVIVTHRGEGTKRYCGDNHAAAALMRRRYRWRWLLVLLLPARPPQLAVSNVGQQETL